ncbi:MAG: DNA polymerase III subunit alpha, partial [Spirochaetes bacterium]|nr:DNA polymerase III subunit alpha [Spirochaetota bacterium]
MKFVHLHTHSDYSILDGAIPIDRMIDKALEFGMPALALTDHGNMFGALEFYQKARKKGITPIIGQEFYVAAGSRLKRESVRDGGKEKAYHLILLAKNEAGYRNLIKLSSIGYTEGFYYKPRIDLEVLAGHSGGLICSSACLSGEIPVSILRGRPDEARRLAGTYAEIFGKDHFYLEMQDHGIPEQKTVNAELVKISGETGLPLIATNDAHYLTREDSFPHEVLLCIQTGKTVNDSDRMRFSSDQFYFKSPEEMYRLFPDFPDALFNTHRIYEMIELELKLGEPILPNFEVPEGFNLDTYLRHLVTEGAHRRYGAPIPEKVNRRLDYELSVITKMHFSGYFLIVWDFINYARNRQIPVGPGRGSAAGSIVSYCLGITALDPLRYNLLFERFLNPDRNEMPDMDIDFCADRREEVIDYVKSKYGDDHVSQIITFNKMKSKAVIKDVARTLDIPFGRANEISKLIDEDRLDTAMANSREFMDFYKNDETGKRLIDISLRLEGLVRSAGKHAAGVVISRGPLTDYVPLYMDPKDGSVSTQFEMKTLEQAGMVKMDFLGLKNLSIITKCLALIKETTGKEMDLNSLPMDDRKTYSLLQQGDTMGVFQLEGPGMQNVLKRLGPTTFEDIIAIEALYRPGPLKSGMTDDFIKRKRNPKLINYPHPSLEPVLGDTLGVVVYQEQVMLISQVIAGFSLPEADRLRKAMGKKKIDIINELEEKFLKGAEKNKIDRSLAENLYDMIKKFGEYGFNKSHSAAYAMVTYQTAYLKAHYRIQYMAALISAQPDKQEDVVKYIGDCRAAGIKVLPPSVNKSHFDFTIEGKAIRFGLGAIKGLGERAIENIVSCRERGGGFRGLRDFLEQVDLMVVNKGVLESLIKAGAFDEIHRNRAQLFHSVETLIDTARKLQEDRASGQGNLFGGGPAQSPDAAAVDLAAVSEWPENERLVREKEVLGLFISGHPLARFEKEIRLFSTISLAELTEEQNGKNVSVVGLLAGVEKKMAQKSGQKYAIATVEGLDGSLDIIAFSRAL